jgi:aminopeptidase N
LLVAAPLFAERRHATVVPPLPAPFVADAAPPVDVFSAADLSQVRTTHVALELEVDFEHDQVRGSAIETIVNLSGAKTFTVDTRNLEIGNVLIDGAPATWSLASPTSIGQPLTIDIQPATRIVRIDYASKANPQSVGLSWLAPLATEGDVAPFLYTFGEPDRTREWIPIQDTPGVRVTYDATIRVPPGLLAVMSAKNPTETRADGIYTFSMTKPIPPYLIALAVGRLEFHALSDRTGFYAEPENVAAAIEDLQYLPSMLDAAERLLGPYPFDRYDIVLMPPAFQAGGMENPQANFIKVQSASPGNHAVPAVLSSVVAHELSHSWTGDLVTCGTWNDTWLNEGFATYYQARILDEMQLPERAEIEYYFDRVSYNDYVNGTMRSPQVQTLHRSFKRGDALAVFNTASYQKGGMFLKMIEDTAGRAAFDGFVHEWLARYRFHWVDDVAFMDLLREKIASFDSLHADTWVYGTGFPPNITAPASSAMWTRLTNAAASFAGGKSLASLGASSWTPEERDLFMWTATSTLAGRMPEVDQTFHMSALTTTSTHWWIAMANTLYAPDLPGFERMLMRGGADVQVVYQTLAKTVSGLAWARELYKKARPQYDWQTQRAVDSILQVAPP